MQLYGLLSEMSLGRQQDAAVTSPSLGEMLGWFLSSWGRQKLLGLELPKGPLCCKENTVLGAAWWKKHKYLLYDPRKYCLGGSVVEETQILSV